MGQALYRKYRPKQLADAVGQDHITKVLATAIKSGQISHAYLLTGPRGVGKTSIARILAHEINGLVYDDTAHLDIIEIDAASNRRIDEIRDLRDRVNTAPASAKYKVYIIDEVHMLTKEAFNALLKTLEEPPAHVIFILATTESHKLPDTIISRTQHFSFRPVAEQQVVDHLKHITKQEKIAANDEALQLIARHGGGSFRDSIGLLDQLGSGGGKITARTVEQLLGIVSDSLITSLVDSIKNGDGAAVVRNTAQLLSQGYEPARIAGQVAAVVRSDILAADTSSPLTGQAGLHLLKDLLAVPAARDQAALLEVTLLTTALRGTTSGPVAVTIQPVTQTKQPEKPANTASESTVAETQTAAQTEPPKPLKKAEPAAAKPSVTISVPAEAVASTAAPTSDAGGTVKLEIDITDLWKQVLDAIKKQYNTLYGIARMAKPSLEGQTLTLAFTFAFHQKRVNEAKNRKLLAETVARLSGQAIDIVCTVEAKPSTAKSTDKPQDLSAISTIFGGGELLES